MARRRFKENLGLVNESTVAVGKDGRFVGSGIVVSSTGLIVTCEHVVRNARRAFVKLRNRRIPVEVYKKDPETDLAILRIHEKIEKNARIRKAGKLAQGDEIFVVGFPSRQDAEPHEAGLSNVSRGIISSIHADEHGIVCYFECNVSVNHGNSGGPVLDANGEIIGIVATRLYEDMACCIPIDRLLSLISEYEMDPFAMPLAEQIRRKMVIYKNWAVFKHYINLRCRVKNGYKQDLMKYVLDVWLPDPSKPILAIFGEFGSGKTLFSHRVAYELFKNHSPEKKLPFFIKLHDMKRYGYKNLKDLLVDQIGTNLGISDLAWPVLENFLCSGKVLLLYDGFEEMTMKASRFQLVDNFRGILSTIMPGTKAIVTCRSHYFSTEEERRILIRTRRPDQIESLIVEESNPESVAIVYIEPFDDGDVQEYLKSKLPDWASLYRKINNPQFYDLADLAKRPIFLDVIVETIPHLEFVGKQLTATDLYRRYTEMCFKREGEKLGLAPEQQSQLIEQLAFEVYKGKTNYLSFELVEATWSSMMHYKSGIDAEQFIRKYPFFRKAGKTEKGLDFIHQSFFEFFVAKRIFRSILDRDHTLYATEYLTAQIDKYLFELLRDADKIPVIIAWLERHPDVNVRMNCALTLGRTGEVKFGPILRERLEKEKDIGAAGRISEALAALGDQGALMKFLRNLEKYAYLKEETGKPDDHSLLYDFVGPVEEVDTEIIDCLVKNLNHANARIRKYAVFILGRTGKTECISGLIQCLKDMKETIRARRYAAAALGIIGNPSALTALENIANSCEENSFLRQECLKAIARINEQRKQFM